MSSLSWFAFPSPFIWWQMLLYLCAYAWGSWVIGAFGVGGGVIDVPLMLLLPSISPELAVGTCFVSSIVPGTLRCVQMYRFGHLDLLGALPFMLGAMCGGLAGQALLPHLPSGIVAVLVCALCSLAGLQIQRNACSERHTGVGVGEAELNLGLACEEGAAAQEESGCVERSSLRKVIGKSAVGLVASTLASVSGTGAPLILIPLWMWWDPKIKMKHLVGTMYPFAMAQMYFASVGALAFGQVDLGLVSLITPVSCCGYLIGGLMMERMSDSILKFAIGVILMLVGAGMGIRQLLSTMH
eukprot:TRINITY_DN67686_c0_g1_i1.p1 TRINITY_DN67686_c0_g1~~TRINITY_DN67686_c0_g1_i1.p1  ORF type:complete len:298 (+),score=42.63 TRINITY_DN67686_c0_g1_i1:54-947(+)